MWTAYTYCATHRCKIIIIIYILHELPGFAWILIEKKIKNNKKKNCTGRNFNLLAMDT